MNLQQTLSLTEGFQISLPLTVPAQSLCCKHRFFFLSTSWHMMTFSLLVCCWSWVCPDEWVGDVTFTSVWLWFVMPKVPSSAQQEMFVLLKSLHSGLRLIFVCCETRRAHLPRGEAWCSPWRRGCAGSVAASGR